MLCPECKSEYNDELKRCPVCGASPKEDNSPDAKFEAESGYTEFVTIIETSDRALIAFVKSVLQDAGIKYFINGESLLDLGRFALNAKIQVDKEDAETARELLKDVL